MSSEVGPINHLLHNFRLALLSPLVAGYLAQRYWSGKSRPGWDERMGRLPSALAWTPNARPRIWIHAVSVGEVVAAIPILRELRAELPDYELLLSVITPAGHEIASQQAAPFVNQIFYFPMDLPWVTRRVVQTIRPQVFVSLESELWPNLLHELKRAGTTTMLVNGRISDVNFARASRYFSGLFRWMLSNMDVLLMQSERDAERVRLLGHIADSGRVRVVGNSKFDQEIARLTPEQTLALIRRLKLPDDAPVFVAGSTRSTEEEAQVIAAYLTMRAEFPELCLLVAPRHLNRTEELVGAMQAAGLDPVRKTGIESASAPVQHLVLDTIGELANVYAVGTFAFVGNSFPPVDKGGGQNLLQPLAHGKAALFGPKTATIRSEVALATAAGVGFRVENGAELAAQGLRLLRDAALRRNIEQQARALIAANRGVAGIYAAAVAQVAQGRLASPPSSTSPPSSPASRLVRLFRFGCQER